MPCLNGVARHFLTGEELSAAELDALLDRAAELKAGRRQGVGGDALAGKTVALLFERPSTRTRVSFEVGVVELGGHPLALRADELQLGRGESIADTARVLSRYVHAIVIRSGADETVAELAAGASVPVINGLTPRTTPARRSPTCSPCASASERSRASRSPTSATATTSRARWRSSAAPPGSRFGSRRRAAMSSSPAWPRSTPTTRGPPPRRPTPSTPTSGSAWATRRDAERRRADLAPYRLNEELLGLGSERAIALHCLPAHPGEEISEGVLYGERSAIWDQAENRLHAQKALLELLAGARG